MADIGPDANVAPGDQAVLIGKDGDVEHTAWDMAELLGTIPYEVTSLISERVQRVYVP